MNHTPTPWVIANTGTDCPQISAPAKGHGYYSLIASVTQRDKHPLYGGEISTQEALANAEFVVRACNAHEELVQALKEMTTILSNIQNTLTGYLTPDSTLDQDDCINAILNISDHKETLSKQRSALQLLTTIEKGS